jgi:IS30 family transposase
VLLVRVPSKDAKTVINALIKSDHKLPRELYTSLTWDRDKEIADHQRFSLATDIDVYVCDPQQPWQRGSNANANGVLRQYFPKGTDLSNVCQNRLNAVAKRLSDRPRKTLGYYSPAKKFHECVAATD